MLQMIKTITDYQSLTLSMIRVPKQLKITYTCHTKMNQQKEKTCSREKNIFQGRFGFFSNFRGELTKKWVMGGGGADQHSLLAEISFFRGGLRGMLPCMVTLPLFHFQNMSLTFCQTKFSQLQKMLLVSHKMIFLRKRDCVFMRNYAETCKGICGYNLMYNFFIQLLPIKSYVFVAEFFKGIYHENEAFPKATPLYGNVPLYVIFHVTYS